MTTSFLVTLIWSLAVCVIFYRSRHSFLYFLHRAVDKATLVSAEEYRRRYKDPGVMVPRPFLRPALKKVDEAFAAIATEAVEQVTAERRERELTEVEKLADLALFAADPSLAQELGYEVPEHTCRWSRAYRSGQPPGPFTCEVCGRPWEDSNLLRRRERWGLPS